MAKKRLDRILVEKGYFETGAKAQTAIMSNQVKIGGKLTNKSGTQIKVEEFEERLLEDSSYLEISDNTCLYVSRGGYKLQKAIDEFNLDFSDSVVWDIGSSTGGFTDCALQAGAKLVFAIDVGKGQLDYKLREDSRVVVLEGVNIKDLEMENLREASGASSLVPDFVVLDLSFISILKVLSNLKSLLGEGKIQSPQFVFLIKPQFEAGKEIADKFQGIITNDKTRQEILDETIDKIQEQGFELKGLVESPIKGAKGNIEYLAYFLRKL